MDFAPRISVAKLYVTNPPQSSEFQRLHTLRLGRVFIAFAREVIMALAQHHVGGMLAAFIAFLHHGIGIIHELMDAAHGPAHFECGQDQQDHQADG